MSWSEKISRFLSLSTPVIDNDVERFLSNRKLRNQLLEDIDNERKYYTSSNENTDEERTDNEKEIKRVGNFEFHL